MDDGGVAGRFLARRVLAGQPGGIQRVVRDETELVAKRVSAIKASLAPGLIFYPT